MSKVRMHHFMLEFCVVTVLLQMALGACIIPKRTIPNGSIRYHRRRDFKSTQDQETHILLFRCNHGYTRVGPRVIFCKNDEWTAQIPQCIKVECEEPPSISNGKYTLKIGDDGRKVVGSTATYSCNAGFELENDTSDVLTCELDPKTNDTHWSNLTARCKEKKSCPDPGASADGTRKGSCCFVGDVLEYSCKEGFELVGIDTVVCFPTGNWSAPRPLCRQIFCDQPEPLLNGSIPEVESTNITAFPYQFEITYVCNEGYRLIGDSWRLCSKNGWSGDTPYCEEIRCPDPGVPEHGLSSSRSLKIGSKVFFGCLEGYSLIGSFEIYCMPNGQWNGEVARCDNKDNYCPDPGIPVNGMKNSSHYEMGSKIHFQCRPGYAFMGSDVIECLPNRTWSEKGMKCIGPYEFDNNDRVSEILKVKVEGIARQQIRELKECHLASHSIWLQRTHESTPSKLILDLNYPKRFILYFVFDTSHNIRERDFRRTVEFAKAIIKKVGVSEYGARIGALTFGSNAEIAFLPTNYKRTEDVLRALDEIKYTGNGAETLTSCLEDLIFTFIPVTREVVGGREQKSIVFILTDGRTNMRGSIAGAKLLKATGVEVYSIGIASYIPQKSLIEIASEPKYEHAFILQNYAVFDRLSQEITDLEVDYSRCGLRPKRRRTTDGENSFTSREAVETWPWMAALYFTSRFGDTKMKCSGSIIHDLYILTTAHCVYYEATEKGRKESQITVHLGLTDIPNKLHEQVNDGKKLYIHEKYLNDGNFDYDIALLKLERPIVYNAFVRPICLPPTSLSLESILYKPNKTAIVTGWGVDARQDEGKRVPFRMRQYLKEVNLTLQSKENCVDFLKTKSKNMKFTERMLCAGGDGEDTCVGDSGSPLMQPRFDSDGNIYWTQVGITGWGFPPCGREGSYGFYTHVQNLVSWITETIKQTINE